MALRTGIVAYDIANNRRRKQVRDLLQEYGIAVQESVFVATLAPTQWAELERRMRRIARGGDDDVRCWMVCAGCMQRAAVWCGPERPPLGSIAVL